MDGVKTKCPFLVTHNTLSSCRIYHTRLGVRIGDGVFCINRNLVPFDYKGCPYNTNKPILW